MIKSLMDEQDRLKNYMEKLESLNGRMPSEGELLRWQKEFFLEPGDLKKLDMLVERHSDRADIYLHRDNVTGAIEEMERAAQLTPRDPFLHLHLARLFKNRYENYGFLRRDRLRARDEAEITTKLDPSLTEPASLIKDMENIERSLKGRPNRRPVIILILTALLVLIMILYSQRDALRQWIFRALNPPKEVHYVPPEQPFDPSLPREIAADSYDFNSRDLELSLIKSEIAPVNDHWGYTLHGGLSSPGQGINRAEIILRFLDRDYRLLHEENVSLTGEASPIILPGENLPVDFFFFLPVSPELVERISILPGDIELLMPPPYDRKKQKIWWDVNKPEGVSLELEEREYTAFEGYDGILHIFTLDLVQKGMKEINGLELTFTWNSDREETLFKKTMEPVNENGPPLKAGEKRALRFTLVTPLEEDLSDLRFDVRVSSLLLDQAFLESE